MRPIALPLSMPASALAEERPSRRRLLVGLGALALAGCAREAPSGAMQLELGIVDWVGYAPLYVGQAKGLFRDLGLDLTVRNFRATNENEMAFAGGRLDGSADVLSSAAELAARGKDFRVVMVIDRSIGADGVLASNAVRDLADLKGRRVALEEGSVSHYFFLQVLREAGLGSKDIELVNTSPADAAAAYQSGNVDVAVTYAPFLNVANAGRKDGRILFDSSRLPYAIADIYVFDAQVIARRPQALEAFVQGIFRGLAYIEAHPDESAAIVARTLKISPAEVTEFLKGVRLADLATNLDMLTNPQSPGYVPATMATLARFLKEQGQIAAVPDLSRIVEPRFVLAAQKNLP